MCRPPRRRTSSNPWRRRGCPRISVSDQKPRPPRSSCQKTGARRRSSANHSCGDPFAHRSRSVRSMSENWASATALIELPPVARRSRSAQGRRPAAPRPGPRAPRRSAGRKSRCGRSSDPIVVQIPLGQRALLVCARIVERHPAARLEPCKRDLPSLDQHAIKLRATLHRTDRRPLAHRARTTSMNASNSAVREGEGLRGALLHGCSECIDIDARFPDLVRMPGNPELPEAGVVSGWNWIPHAGAPSTRNAWLGEASLRASTLAPAGGSNTSLCH